MALDLDPNHVFRDFVTPGIPSSGNWNPRKPEIRQLLTEWWQTLIALVADAGGLELPNLLISMTVTGGDENDIVAEANLPVPSGPGVAVFSIVIEQANTGPVTINGKPLLSNTGNPLAAGALAADGIYLFLDNGDSYRLLSDYVSSSIVAAAEAAAMIASGAAGQAVDAAERAESAAAGVEFPVSYAPQTLTPEQQEQARTNIAALSYDEQTLTPAQQEQARENIGIVASMFRDYVTPQDFGAVGDGVADDTAAVQAAVNDGRPVFWGHFTYRITDTISTTASGPTRWFSAGAKVVLDTSAPVQFCISVEGNGHDVTIDGTLSLDAGRNSYTGFHFRNSTTTYADFYATDLRVRNCYRSGTLFAGGDGIWIRGAWTIVDLIADVRDIAMAPGAGIPGSVGITGISITQDNTTGEAPLDVRAKVYIENVQSEDPEYTADQDGLKVFGKRQVSGRIFPWFSTAKISGTFKNCGQRSIKSQMHETIVDGATFIREGTVLGTNVEGDEEVNFQYGAGVLTNFVCFYYSARPDCVVSSEGSYNGSGLIVPVGAFVSNGRIYTRGTSLATVARMKTYEAQVGQMTLENITVRAETNHPINIAYVWCVDNSIPLISVSLKDITAGIVPTSSNADSAWVRCVGSSEPTIMVQATGLINTHGEGGNRPLVTRSSTTNLQTSLYGLNRGVTV